MPPKAGDDQTQQQRREIAARVRAAMGYAGLKLDEVVERCELLTAANIRRTVGARRDTPAGELMQIAAACGVPWSWFESGQWDTQAADESPDLRFGEGTLEQRMIVVETYLAVLAKALAMQGIELESLRLPDTHQRAPLVAQQRRPNAH